MGMLRPSISTKAGKARSFARHFSGTKSLDAQRKFRLAKILHRFDFLLFELRFVERREFFKFEAFASRAPNADTNRGTSSTTTRLL